MKLFAVYSIKCQCCPHIETSQLICCANKLTGFYMGATMVFNWLTIESGWNSYIEIFYYGSDFFWEHFLMNVPRANVDAFFAILTIIWIVWEKSQGSDKIRSCKLFVSRQFSPAIITRHDLKHCRLVKRTWQP